MKGVVSMNIIKKNLHHFLKIKPIKLYIALSVLIFLARFIPLAATYGIEHDSAWYLGVAKNLAHKGIYASNTNTVAYEGEGAFSSIHNKFSVQDIDGYVYFPAGVTVGPSYVLPQAVFLKVFGDGWWQYRIWPIISFALMLALFFIITYRLGGVIALILLQLWLWFLPQLIVNYSFEALSESLALAFVLLSILSFVKASKSSKKQFYFLAGVFLAAAALTKNLYLINSAIFVPVFIYEVIKDRKKLKMVIIRWIILAFGFMLPMILFEGYRFLYLVTHFGIESWHAVNKEIQLTYQMSGSGVDTLKKCLFDQKLFISKFNIWFDIGLYQVPFAWIGFFLMPVILFTQKQNRLLIFLLYSAAFISFTWFVLLSPLGWGRHIYHALMISIILMSVSIATLFKLKGLVVKIFGLVIFTILVINLVTIPKATGNLILTQTDIEKWFEFRKERGIEGFPSIVLIPQHEQQQVINFFQKNIKTQDRVYYEDAFVLADIGTLTNRIIFPILRYKNERNIPNNRISYLMLGPYQITSYKLVEDDYVSKSLKKCTETVFKNNHYLICKLKDIKELYE